MSITFFCPGSELPSNPLCAHAGLNSGLTSQCFAGVRLAQRPDFDSGLSLTLLPELQSSLRESVTTWDCAAMEPVHLQHQLKLVLSCF